jgi:hypothetical protein
MHPTPLKTIDFIHSTLQLGMFLFCFLNRRCTLQGYRAICVFQAPTFDPGMDIMLLEATPILFFLIFDSQWQQEGPQTYEIVVTWTK